MRNKVLGFILLWLAPMLHFAQQAPKSFSVEPAKFIGELEDYIKSAKLESADKVIEEFAGYWSSGRFNSTQQRAIISTCNTMLMKKFRVAPEFESYLSTVSTLAVSVHKDKVDDWQKMMESMMGKTRKAFLDFLVFSRGMFAANILFENSGKKWQIPESNFKFSLLKGEPVVEFEQPTKLYCFTSGDTIIVRNTYGVFYANQDLWVGRQGKVDWARAFLDTNKVYAEFGKYQIDMKRAEFSVDSVTFYNKNLFTFPMKGKLTEKAYAAYGGGDKALSPRFDSYEKNFLFPQFKGEVKFSGGFAMKGSKILGTGEPERRATFLFMYKGKVKMKVQALEYIIGEEKTHTEKAAVSIMIEGDSIYHPQLSFYYDYKDKRVLLSREFNEPISAAPFYDSFHKLEFYVDEVKWILDQAKLDFRNISPEKPAIFESFNYFKDGRYEDMQGMLNTNPIYDVRTYYMKNDSMRTFHIEDYAAFLGLKKERVVAQVIDLNDHGFLFYDPVTGYIRLRDKTLEYVNAYNKRTDYDVVRFVSTIAKRPHASLNFENHDLNLQGVPRFVFSDSQSVYVEPFDQQLNVRKNRNLDFAGHLHAGRMDFYSEVGPNQGFYFEYNPFKVQFTNVELKFSFEDAEGRIMPIKNSMKNVTGTVLIDHPANKSGRKSYPEYPILQSVKNANVYFDFVSTKKVDYDRTRFFFDVDPFSIDSLDNFDVASMTFDGTLHAGGIMPDFRYVIKAMPDTSLGFFKDTSYYDLYVSEGKPKGKGNIHLSLSNAGFHGAGVIDYLASKSVSDDFFLHLDSTTSNTKSFELRRTDIYPKVSGNNVAQNWLPYQDSMFISTIDEDMAMFESRAFLKGNAVLTPKTLYGSGKLSWENADLFSDRFNFSPVTTKSDKSIFRLASLDPGKFAIIINDVKSFVDFDKRYAEFNVIKAGQIVDLPYNQYQMAFTDYKWNMDAQTIDMTAREIAGSKNVQKNFFRSMHPEQDSLFFYAGKATYYLSNYFVVAEKVPYIYTADAKVIPDSNKVVIEPNAVMQTLHNAVVYTDTIKQFHTIVRSELDILGRKKFKGSGYYSYTDRTKKKQEIYFENIYVNKLGRTSASGPIYDTMDFVLGPRIQFKGTATLISNDRNMDFDGYILPIHKMGYPRSEWFRHTQRINPDSVFIKYQDARNEDKQLIHAGMYLSTDSAHVYPAFFTRKRNYSDLELTKVEGVLYYDDKTAELKAGAWEKLFENALVGNTVVLNEKNMTAISEGKVNLGLPKGKFNVKAAGTITALVKDSSYTLDLSMLLDIPLPEAALKIIADSVFEVAGFGEEMKYNNPRMIKAIAEIMDFPDEEGKKASERELRRQDESMREDNNIRMSSQLTKTFLFSDIKLIWNTRKRNFVSKGNIGITAIGKTKIDRKLKGKLEIIKKRSGDEFRLLLEPVSGTWFYFQFFRGQMMVISSNPTFNQLIKENIDKLSTGDYKLRFGSNQSKTNFLRGTSDEEEEE